MGSLIPFIPNWVAMGFILGLGAWILWPAIQKAFKEQQSKKGKESKVDDRLKQLIVDIKIAKLEKELKKIRGG